MATLLFKDNADTEARYEEDQTPLHFDAYYNNVKVVKLLVECNADIKGWRQQTHLYTATHYDGRKIVKLWLEHMVDTTGRFKGK